MVPCVNNSRPQSGISIGLAVYARDIRVTNTQTDVQTQTTLRAAFVAIGRILCNARGAA